MSLTLGDNFSYNGAKPLDARLTYSTLADMVNKADSTLYDGIMAYCVATDKTYQWKSTNSLDDFLGKWREFKPGGDPITVDDALSASSENPVQNKVINTALNGKLGTSGNGENVTVDTFTTSSASMPTLTAGETLKVLFGKLVKWMNDVATTLSSKSVVTVSRSGTASSSAVSKQNITVDGVAYEIDGTKYMETTITTSTSAPVNATFSNSAITTSSVIDVFTSQYGLNHSNIAVSSGSCTVTFPAQSSAATVTVRIYIR